MLPLSVLDLAPVSSGTPAAESVRRTVDLARLAERRGFVRYWFAEHHSLPSVASSSPDSIERRRWLTLVGRSRTVRNEIERRAEAAGADEVMVVTNVWSHEARLRSYELLAEAFAG